MGWADDMYAHGLTNIHGGVLKEHDDEWIHSNVSDEGDDGLEEDALDLHDQQARPVKAISNEVIRNCKFKYSCPMKWNDLEQTSDTDVRYCPTCKKTVHHCHTDEQLRIAILQDHCVAIKVSVDAALEAPSFDDSDDMELGIPF